jgi:hypothetical protein
VQRGIAARDQKTVGANRALPVAARAEEVLAGGQQPRGLQHVELDPQRDERDREHHAEQAQKEIAYAAAGGHGDASMPSRASD